MSRPNARKISPEFYQLQTAEKVLNRSINANLEIIQPEIFDIALDLYEDAIRELRNLNEIAKITQDEGESKEPTKAPDKCTCGDCHYFHGPTGFNRYGKEIGECYAQKDAPTVEKDEKSCSDFDWKGDKDE